MQRMGDLVQLVQAELQRGYHEIEAREAERDDGRPSLHLTDVEVEMPVEVPSESPEKGGQDGGGEQGGSGEQGNQSVDPSDIGNVRRVPTDLPLNLARTGSGPGSSGGSADGDDEGDEGGDGKPLDFYPGLMVRPGGPIRRKSNAGSESDSGSDPSQARMGKFKFRFKPGGLRSTDKPDSEPSTPDDLPTLPGGLDWRGIAPQLDADIREALEDIDFEGIDDESGGGSGGGEDEQGGRGSEEPGGRGGGESGGPERPAHPDLSGEPDSGSSEDHPPRAGASVDAVPGVGRARAQQLADAGVSTVGDLAAADPDAVADATDLSPERATRLVNRAAFVARGARDATAKLLVDLGFDPETLVVVGGPGVVRRVGNALDHDDVDVSLPDGYEVDEGELRTLVVRTKRDL